MKKLLFAMLALVPVGMVAQEVSEGQARQAAAEFIAAKAHNGSLRKAPAAAAGLQLAWASSYKSNDPEIYVFNIPDDGGFVIVSGDEGTSREILGWCDHGSFDPENMPPALRYLSAQYVVDIAQLRQEDAEGGNARAKVRRAQTSGYGSVAPMLKTNWNQWGGYNDLLPDYPTGCVATAVAQIMNYHQWPKHGYGKHTNMYLADKGIDQTVDFSQSNYNWAAMKKDDPAAISKLMYDIGCAVNMMYTPSESGAYTTNALKALVTNFGYDEGSIREDYMTHAEDLRKELDRKRPILYTGQDTVTTVVWLDATHWYRKLVSDSHAFVCDGYSDDGLFHFNLGWGGTGDGYYSLDVIRPYGDGNIKYSYGPMRWTIMGIKPGEKTCVDGIWYDLDDANGTATIGSGAYEGDVIIPQQITYDGKTYRVAAMHPTAFAERELDTNVITNLEFNADIEEFPANLFTLGNRPGHVEKVSFGGGVRRIADRAFYDMADLEKVTIGDDVQSIGVGSFENCKELSDVTLGKSLTEIPDYAFSGCKLWEIDVPESVKRIGKYGVQGSLYYVTFNGPIELDTCAVSTWEQMWSLKGLEHCTRIAYRGISGATGVFKPNHNAKYDRYAISGRFDKIIIPADFPDYDYTTALDTKEFYVEPGNPNLASSGGALYTKDMKTLLALPKLKSDLTYDNYQLFIPTGVAEMTEQPLSNAYKFMYFPPSLRRIKSKWLCGYNILRIYSMATVPPEFDGDEQDDISINASLHVPVGCEAAYAASPVWSKFSIIKGDMHTDGQFLYTHEPGANYAYVIGRNADAFTGHDFVVPSVIEIDGEKIPVVAVEACVFRGDPAVESVTLGSFIDGVGIDTFKNCENLKRVNILGDIYDLSDSAFENCKSLVDVSIARNNHVRSLGSRLFAGCTSLKTVDLTTQEEYGFWQLGTSIFEDCTSLSTVKGLSNTSSLPGRAFANSGLETFHIGANMAGFNYDDPFQDCHRLYGFTVDSENEYFFEADGVLYKYNSWSSYPWSLYCCPERELEDGQSVVRTTLNISERCDMLDQVLPSTLREVVIPATLKSIQSGPFSYTENLEKITVLRDDPDFVTSNVFWALYKKATLQVPKGRKEAYAAHEEWGKFGTIVEIDPDDYPSPEAIKAQLEAEQNKPDDPTIGNALEVLMKDGATHFIRLAQLPVITIGSGRDLNINGQGISLTLPISDIRYYRFGTYDLTGVEPTADSRIELDFSGGDLNAGGLECGQHVMLYDLQGRLLRQATAGPDGTVSLALSDLPSAVYILKVNEISYKILKK